ncbi:MAG TPA: terminase small subunit [archaeon]|nr:terminase small subunit [archaeon]
MTSRRISKKQKVFINEYLKCWNAAQAAIRAGYSERSAKQTGHRLITNDYLSKIIKERINEIVMSADEALSLLSDQARASLDDCMDIDPKGKISLNFKKAKEKGKLHLIKSIVPTASGLKVELYSSQRALELIGKAHGVFVDKVDITQAGQVTVYLPDNQRDKEKDREKLNGNDRDPATT